jgi:hypothetical protein
MGGSPRSIMGGSPMFAVLRSFGRYSGQEARARRSSQSIAQKIASLLFDSIGVPIEIEEYLEHGRAAHDTLLPMPRRSGKRGANRYCSAFPTEPGR